jgi:hypothetical protein
MWWEGVTRLILLRKGEMQGCCKHSYYPAVSVNSGETFTSLEPNNFSARALVTVYIKLVI